MSTTNSLSASITRATTPGESRVVPVAASNTAVIPVTITDFVDSEIAPRPDKILLVIGGMISIVVVALTLITGITIWLKRVVVSDDDEQFYDSEDGFSDLKKVMPRKDANSTGSEQSHYVITMYDDEDYARDADSDSQYTDSTR